MAEASEVLRVELLSDLKRSAVGGPAPSCTLTEYGGSVVRLYVVTPEHSSVLEVPSEWFEEVAAKFLRSREEKTPGRFRERQDKPLVNKDRRDL